MPQLRHLSVGWCARIGNASCATVADYCPHLRSLNLAGVYVCVSVSVYVSVSVSVPVSASVSAPGPGSVPVSVSVSVCLMALTTARAFAPAPLQRRFNGAPTLWQGAARLATCRS